MVSTFSLSPLAKENESLNHFPLMVLKKVLFPIPCGPGRVSTLSGYGFYLFLVAACKRERIVKPPPTDGLEKGAFSDALRSR